MMNAKLSNFSQLREHQTAHQIFNLKWRATKLHPKQFPRKLCCGISPHFITQPKLCAKCELGASRKSRGQRPTWMSKNEIYTNDEVSEKAISLRRVGNGYFVTGCRAKNDGCAVVISIQFKDCSSILVEFHFFGLCQRFKLFSHVNINPFLSCR